jgi:hypothetical protein
MSTIMNVDMTKSTEELGTPPDGAMLVGMSGVVSRPFIREELKKAFKSAG